VILDTEPGIECKIHPGVTSPAKDIDCLEIGINRLIVVQNNGMHKVD